MRSVVRAAYSGRLAGSSDTGVICNSDSGCSRWRLASAKKTSRPNVSSIASTSQRVPTRPVCLDGDRDGCRACASQSGLMVQFRTRPRMRAGVAHGERACRPIMRLAPALKMTSCHKQADNAGRGAFAGVASALPVQQAPPEPAQPSAQADRGFDAAQVHQAGAIKPLRQTQDDGGNDHHGGCGVTRQAMEQVRPAPARPASKRRPRVNPCRSKMRHFPNIRTPHAGGRRKHAPARI